MTSTARPAKPHVLLQTHFKELLLLNFEIDPKILENHLPRGLNIAYYNDAAFVSLIAMQNSKVNYKGFTFPISSFPTLGLRFYVERKTKQGVNKGVYYIRQYVPRKSLAIIQNWLYQSMPRVMKIKCANTGFNENDSAVMPVAQYDWYAKDNWNHVKVTGHSILRIGEKETKEKFVLDHHHLYYYRKNILCESYAEHPAWVTWGAASGNFDCDSESLFGREFVKPLKRRPASVFLARGSDVTVYRPVELTGQTGPS
jgi:hypothetical protein